MSLKALLLCLPLLACTPTPALIKAPRQAPAPPPPLAVAPPSPKAIDASKFSWRWLRPLPQGNSLTVSLATESQLYVAGYGGTFLTSPDQGKSWTPRDTGTRLTLSSMSQNQAGELFVAGGDGVNGVILKTRDHGATWDTIKTPGLASLEAIWASEREVFAVGWDGAIYYSAESGASWSAQESGTQKTLMSVVGADAEVYALAVDGLFLSSKNHGKTWTQGRVPGGAYFYQLWREPTGDLFAVGSEAKLYRSTNKGKSWKATKLAETGDFLHIWGDGVGRVYLTGNSSSWRSEDHGKTWAKLAGADYLGGISGVGARLYTAGARAEITESDDYGDSWRAISANLDAELYDLCGLDASTLFVAGRYFKDGQQRGVLFDSHDGGASWRETKTEHPPLRSVWAASRRLLIAVGDAGTILRSVDQGSTWEPLQSNTKAELSSVWARSESEVYVVGTQGTLLRSVDLGNTWESIGGQSTSHYLSVYGSSSGALFIAGAQKRVYPPGVITAGEMYTSGARGFLWRSVNRGETWEEVIPVAGDSSAFTDVWADALGVYATRGVSMYSSFDDGKTWSAQQNRLSLTFFAGAGIGEERLVIGSKGAAFRSKRDTFTQEPLAATVSLRAAWSAADGTFFAVGENGSILRFGP